MLSFLYFQVDYNRHFPHISAVPFSRIIFSCRMRSRGWSINFRELCPRSGSSLHQRWWKFVSEVDDAPISSLTNIYTIIIKPPAPPANPIHCLLAAYLSKRVNMRARAKAITASTARIEPDTSKSRPTCSKNSLRLTPKIALVAMFVLFFASP